MEPTDEQYRPLFNAARALGVQFNTPDKVERLKVGFRESMALVTGSPVPLAPAPAAAAPVQLEDHRHISVKGQHLIHSFESCGKKRSDGMFEAYPDPGSKDGHPWTIGWGSTGPDIRPGVVWTQAQCDARFAQSIGKYEKAVLNAIGNALTTQNQFDAMVSLCYNIGPIAFAKSTVARKHKAGDYHGAAAAFAMWVKNDGKVMRGLQRRRAAEADLYDDL
jgi:GH24 family phage-related lysozyme (muramidase)